MDFLLAHQGRGAPTEYRSAQLGCHIHLQQSTGKEINNKPDQKLGTRR